MQNTKKAPAIRARMLAPLLQAAGIALTLSPLAIAEVEQELDALVVSATRLPTDAGKTTASVTVLDPQQLQEQGITSLQTALNESPGVISTSTSGQLGALGSLFIRGTATAESQVVVDGIRLSDATGMIGNVFGSERLQDLGRIEVLRGPQSAFYGGEAMGGVVWLETGRGSGPATASISAEAGSFGTSSFSGTYQGSTKQGLSWYLAGGDEWTKNDARNDDYHQEHAAFRVEAPVADQLNVGVTFRQLSSQYDDYGNDHETLQSTLGTVYLSGMVRPGWQTNTVLGYYQEQYVYLDPYADKYSNQLGRVSLSSNNSFDIMPGHRLLVGAFYDHIDYYTSSVPANPPYPTSVTENTDRYGANVGWEWSPVESFTANAAARWEDYDVYGRHTTWRFGTGWTIPDQINTRLVAGVGKAFSPPNYTDLYGDMPYSLPNPGLTAETSLGEDVGIEQPITKNSAVSVTYFHNSIKDLLYYSPGNSSNGYVGQEVNLPGTTETQGVETAAHASFWHGVVSTKLAWTFLDKSISGQPKNVATASVETKPLDRLTFGAGVSYVGAASWGGTPVDNYTLIRFYGNYKLTDSVTLHARMENAFDRNYQLSNFNGQVVQGPGTGIYGGLTVTW